MTTFVQSKFATSAANVRTMLLALGLCLLLAAAALAQQQSLGDIDSSASLARQILTLADKQDFSEVELLLASLAEQDPSSSARVAAVLYASERTYAAGHRPQAATWLKPLASVAPQQFRAAIDDALVWCQVNPSDLRMPTARLLELAEAHSASSFAPSALQLRAEKLVAAKRTDEAIFVYHELLAQFPQSRHTPANLVSVARLHHELQQHREAWDYLQRIVTDYPQADQIDEALYVGTQVAEQLGKEDALRQWRHKLVSEHEDSPYWPDAAVRLAEQQATQGEGAAAKALAERLLEKAEQRRENADLAGRAAFLLVRIAVGESDWNEVESRSQEILSRKPGEPLQTLARFWHAESAYRRGQPEEAFTRFLDLSLAIEERKEDWLGVVPLRLAQIEAQKQKWSAAAEWAETAARRYPRFSRRHEIDYVHGRSLAGLAQFDKAREALTRVTTSESAPHDMVAMAQWLIGETWFQQRQYERAIAAYDQTLSHDAPQWNAAALLQSAKCCEQLNRWGDASKRYEQLLRDHWDTRYVADARSRLEKTHAKVAAQTMSETTTR